MQRLAEHHAARKIPAEAGAMVPRVFRLADRRQDTADTFTMMLEPNDGVAAGVHPRPVHDAVSLRRRRGADLGQR